MLIIILLEEILRVVSISVLTNLTSSSSSKARTARAATTATSATSATSAKATTATTATSATSAKAKATTTAAVATSTAATQAAATTKRKPTEKNWTPPHLLPSYAQHQRVGKTLPHSEGARNRVDRRKTYAGAHPIHVNNNTSETVPPTLQAQNAATG